MHFPLPRHRRRTALAALLIAALAPVAQGAEVQALPAGVQAALQRAKLPDSALSAVVQEVRNGPEPGVPLLRWNEAQPVNPASVFKLLTTFAALDLLGPAWTWSTPVYFGGPVRDGVLEGSLYLRGSGDPTLVMERVWLMLRHLQQLGVREIRGDIVLDRSAWSLPASSPADFDGESARPYNVRPDPLLLNLKAFTLTLRPDPARGIASVSMEPLLAGVAADTSVPLAAGPCEDWRTALKPDWSDPGKVRLTGRYPASCGEQPWPVAYSDPASFNARLLAQTWFELGGRLGGKVLDGAVPAGLKPAWEQRSPPLAEVVRDINKFSNNVMAEQLFLSLPGATRADANLSGSRPEDARALLQRWLQARLGDAAQREVVVANGSGLSRDSRVSALALAQLLAQAWQSPVMPELISSLPVSGMDGTLRRSVTTLGRAHLKTGSLRDVNAVAGFVLSNSGRRYMVVAILNHPLAGAGRPVLDALAQWAIDDAKR